MCDINIPELANLQMPSGFYRYKINDSPDSNANYTILISDISPVDDTLFENLFSLSSVKGNPIEKNKETNGKPPKDKPKGKKPKGKKTKGKKTNGKKTKDKKTKKN